MTEDFPHRWSGWPGAWCLDCGKPDPMEESLTCPDCTVQQDGTTEFCQEHGKQTACTERGSNRHNPYTVRRL